MCWVSVIYLIVVCFTVPLPLSLFAQFYDPGDAAHAKDRLDGYNLDGRNISVLYAQVKHDTTRHAMLCHATPCYAVP